MKQPLLTFVLALLLPLTNTWAQQSDEAITLSQSNVPIPAETAIPEEGRSTDELLSAQTAYIEQTAPTFWDKFINLKTPNKECTYELRIGNMADSDLYRSYYFYGVNYGNSPYGQFHQATITQGAYHSYDSPYIYFAHNNGRRLEFGVGSFIATRARNFYDNTTKEVVHSLSAFTIVLSPQIKWNIIKGRFARFYIGTGANIFYSKMEGNLIYNQRGLTAEYMFSYGITIGTRLYYFVDSQMADELYCTIVGLGYRF